MHCPGSRRFPRDLHRWGFRSSQRQTHELFDERRLRQIVVGFQGQTAEELAEAIREGVKDFTEGAPQSDDITLLVVQYKGNATGAVGDAASGASRRIVARAEIPEKNCRPRKTPRRQRAQKPHIRETLSGPASARSGKTMPVRRG